MSKEAGEIPEEVVSTPQKELENVKSITKEDIKNENDEVENVKSKTKEDIKNDDKVERGVQLDLKEHENVKSKTKEEIKDEIKKVEREVLEVISPLLKELEKVKSKTKEDIKDEIKMIEMIERELRDFKVHLAGLKMCEREFVGALGLMGQQIDIILANLEEDPSKDNVNRITQCGESAERKNQDFMSKDMKQFHESIASMLDPSSSSESSKDPSSQASTSGNAETLAEAGRKKMDKLLEIPTMWSYVKEAFLSLDLQEKRCMFCMLLFPENSIMKRRMLVYLWIAAGFVQGTHTQTAEKNGEACFEELVTKCLIYPIYKEHRAVADGCVLPLKIRKKVDSAAKRDHFFVGISVKSNTSEPDRSTEDETPLEVAVSQSLLDQTLKGARLKVAKSRSLPEQPLMLFSINSTTERVNLSFGNDTYPDIEKMGVLHIGRWQRDSDKEKTKQHIEVDSTEFLEHLGPANKPRYLSMVGISRITELPESIGKIRHLVILDLRACHNLEKLPASIGSLKKLTHLDVSECYLLEHLPSGLSSLTGMQVLKGFVVSNPRSSHACGFQDLAKLKKLRKLTISIGRDSLLSVGDFNLDTWEALRSLTVTCGGIQMHSGIPEKLTISPPPKLEKLDIRCFPMKEVQWLTSEKFSSLKRLYIRGGSLDKLPHASVFSNLEVLCIRFLKDISVSRDDLKKSFPNLTYLQIHECKKVDAQAWECVREINKKHRYPRSLFQDPEKLPDPPQPISN